MQNWAEPALLSAVALSLLPALRGWPVVALPGLALASLAGGLWLPGGTWRAGAGTGTGIALLLPPLVALAAHASAARRDFFELDSVVGLATARLLDWGLFSLASALCGPLAVLMAKYAWGGGEGRLRAGTTNVAALRSAATITILVALVAVTVLTAALGPAASRLAVALPFAAAAKIPVIFSPAGEPSQSLGAVALAAGWCLAKLATILACFAATFHALAHPGSAMRRGLTFGESAVLSWVGTAAACAVAAHATGTPGLGAVAETAASATAAATTTTTTSIASTTPPTEGYVAVLLGTSWAIAIAGALLWQRTRTGPESGGPSLQTFAVRVAAPAVLTAALLCHAVDPRGSVPGAVVYCLGTAPHLGLVALWAALVAVTVAWIVPHGAASLPVTAARKVYHALAVAVMLTGLAWDRQLLSVGLAAAAAALLLVEALRALRVPGPATDAVAAYMSRLIDERDAAPVFTTHLCLIAGLAGPVWLEHIASRWSTTDTIVDVDTRRDDDAGRRAAVILAPLAGLLSAGIGDAAASVVGRLCGRVRWPGSRKTVEGTAAAVFAMSLSAAAIVHLGAGTPMLDFPPHFVAYFAAVALVEACTTHIDNLVLPAVLYAAVGLG
jgi:hypothetical protein